MCSKLVINSGVTHVFYRHPYRDPTGIELLVEAGVTPVHYVRWADAWR
jgi:deoxycytidylate deaminase